MEIHAHGVVHGDVKPSNIVFFPENVKWKLIDLDGAQKARERRAVCFTAPYAAPEVLRGWQEGELPVAQPSSDIWSCGIVAYEVLTGERRFKLISFVTTLPVCVGNRMFEDDLTHDEILEFVLEGKVEEKLDAMENGSHREAISQFLNLDPKERWSAAEALQHVVFQSDPQTTWTQVS